MMSNIFDIACALIARIGSEEEGQTMAEYGLLIAVIAVVVVVAALVLGQSISSLFSVIVTDL